MSPYSESEPRRSARAWPLPLVAFVAVARRLLLLIAQAVVRALGDPPEELPAPG